VTGEFGARLAARHSLLFARRERHRGRLDPAYLREPSRRGGGGGPAPEDFQAGEKTPRLNGAGVRKKHGFKVYLVALYLEERSTDPERIVASDHAKAVGLVFLWNAGRKDTMEEFEQGFRDNSEDQLPELLPQLGRALAIIPDMRKGQMLTFLYQPGIGTIIEVEGGNALVLEGKGLADALLRSVIGKEPYDRDLREDLLRAR
jgi:long-chain acyl-CoA synthetase